MIALEVHLNGEKVCTAGVGELGVLSSIVSWRGTQHYNDGTAPPGASLQLQVSGLTSPSKEHVRWTERNIRMGDRVEIRVIETSAVDLPQKT